MTRTLKNKSIPTTCPYSGLEVVRKPQWSDFATGSNYTSSFAKIGSNIYLSVGRGDLSTIDERLMKAYHQFIQEEFVDYPVVEIKDLANARGITGKNIRGQTLDFYIKNQNKLAAVIYFNGSLQMSMLLKALKTIYAGPIETYVSNSYKDAVEKALQIVKQKQREQLKRVAQSISGGLNEDTTDVKSDAPDNMVLVSKRDITKVIDFIVRFIWDGEKNTGHDFNNLPVQDGHPLAEVFQTLIVLKSDLITAKRELRTEVERANELAKKAKNANRSKSNFLANMSHEIRTPMNGVLGMNSLLLQTNLTDEQRDFAKTVNSSAESLLTIINDILDFSKIEAGRLDLEQVDFNFHVMINELGKLMGYRAEQKKIDFSFFVGPEIPANFIGDPGRLKQVLVNIIGNAVKFTHNGEVRVSCDLVETSGSDMVLRFEVADTGVGIPDDKKGLLFQSFSQADASTTRKYGGTGLGLTIAKQLTRLLGGEIGFESVQGEGSVFWFTACLKVSDKKDEAFDIADISHKKVLYIDNNESNRRFVTRQLQAWNVDVLTAKTAPDGLHLLYKAMENNRPFHAIIADMVMYGMDGPALVRLISNDKKISDVAVIMMTSMGKRGDAAEMNRIGVSAYLTKPVAAYELHECLQEIFGRKEVTTEHYSLITRHSLAERRMSQQRILIVEDNIINQKVAIGMLSKMGYRVVTADNGKQALESLERTWFDLVFMDIQMPVMDGFEATKEIKKRKDTMMNPDVPIVAMTAHAMSGYKEKCLEEGMDDYVTKPIGVQALSSVLEKWLKTASDTGSITAGPIPEERTTAARKKPFDRDAFIKRMMYDEPLADKIVEEFIKDMPKQVASLRNAIECNDYKEMHALAHKIKGSSANICALPLSEVAYKLEKDAVGNKHDLLLLQENFQTTWSELYFNLTGQPAE